MQLVSDRLVYTRNMSIELQNESCITFNFIKIVKIILDIWWSYSNLCQKIEICHCPPWQKLQTNKSPKVRLQILTGRIKVNYGLHQCDQIRRLIVQYLTILTMKTRIGIIWLSRFQFLPIKPSKPTGRRLKKKITKEAQF